MTEQCVAVLGASGFVGGHLLAYLRANGYPTRAVVRRRPTSADQDYRIADACDVYALRDALSGCDCVVHAALGDNSVITGSVAPVYAAAEAVCVRRLIYISSGSVHGQSPTPGTNERSPLSARQAFSYNNAKVRAERALRRLRSRGTVEIVILRPTIVFGPGSRWIFDFADALQTGTAYVVDGARGICNSVYVDNLSYGVTLALGAQDVDGEAFLLGDAETVQWRDLYRPIANAFGVDFDKIPNLSPRRQPATIRQRYLAPWLMSDVALTFKRAVSMETQNTIARLLQATLRRRPAGSAPSAAGAPTASLIPNEMIDLQRCEWRLPNEKAARQLGYAPPVPFAQGCRRSVEWLLERSASTRRVS
jgi:nucleoside-diphosphate-sugar epimerase